MDIVKIEELENWRQEHPDIKHVIVDHGPYGYAELTFNYISPLEYEVKANVLKLGQYDAYGNFHFIDSEGTYHKCFKPKRVYGSTSKTKYR